jgi:adenosine deaminase
MAFLRSLDLKQRVVGGWSEERSLSANGARRRYRHLANFDAQDRDWIRSLPKADLHCHFGTSISLLTVEALAFNTCGHLFTNWTHADVDPEMVPAGVGVLIKDICSIVKRAVFDIAHDPNGIRDKPPAEFFYLAMEKTLEPRGRRPTGRIPSDPYGEVVKALMLKNPPVKDYIIVSLLVAVNACLRRETIDEILQEWQYFEQLHEWCHKLDAERNTGAWIQTAVIRAARLAVQCVDTIIHSIGPVRTIEDSWTTPRNQNVSLVQAGALWQKWHENIQHRVRAAHAIIVRFLAESPPFSPPREAAPTLEELVALPKHPAPDDHSLLRYFWGCSLLGAEHLQYPENVILGAHDLVRQNVKDWVIYTEVRCETPGYSRTGMSSELVTDLLCASFDMAAVFERDYHKGPLIRTNVLLAAKRHKSTEEIEKVVSLLARYLTRSRVFPPDLYRGLPGWWKPAQVVGFDLSGKEDENPKGLPQQIARLIELSSPITIHAGEAASAESIWRAVYLHHARRIGHGVRLREQAKLLQFCINEGICMEMCPVSNIFTSDFIIAGDQNAPENKYDPRRIEHYPLRHFMDCGL